MAKSCHAISIATVVWIIDECELAPTAMVG